jgi:uncharacterized OB-fold protein
MTSSLPVPEPTVNVETETFWSAASEGRLVLPRCSSCDTVIWYPRRFCPSCHTSEVAWIDATGRGTIYSYTVVRQAPGPWKEAVPYVIAYVELDEGPKVLTNVIGVDVESVAIGQQVKVVFERSPEGIGVYRFEPI